MRLNFSEGLTQKELDTPIGYYVVEVETAFYDNLTIGELLESLQGKKITHEVPYFYTIDHTNRLLGIVVTRDILFSQHEAKLSDICRRGVISVSQDESLRHALKLMAQHELIAIPVTDLEGRLCGLFELPAKMSVNHHKHAPYREKKQIKELFQLIGLSVELGKLTSSIQEFRYRMPWLLCNLAAGLICALIASHFHMVLHEFIVIAMFIPLVLTLGESVSMQSMALSLQFLHYKQIPWKRVFKRVVVEWGTAILLGITCGILIGCVYFFWDHRYQPLIAIALSIIFSMLAVTTFGSLLPVVLHSISLDPKVAAGPVVLMLTDIVVTAIYLEISSSFLLYGSGKI